MSIIERFGITKNPTDLELAKAAQDEGLKQWLLARYARTMSESKDKPAQQAVSNIEARLIFTGIAAGLATGVVINPELIKAYDDSREVTESPHHN